MRASMTGHPKALLANATAALLDRGQSHAIPHIHPTPLTPFGALCGAWHWTGVFAQKGEISCHAVNTAHHLEDFSLY